MEEISAREDDSKTERERFNCAYKNFMDSMLPSAKGMGPEILLLCRSKLIRFVKPPSSDRIRPWISLMYISLINQKLWL